MLFSRVFKNASYLSRRTCCIESFLGISVVFFRPLRKNSRTVRKKCRHVCKADFYVSSGKQFLKERVSSMIFFRFSANKFPTFSANFSSGCQNCILRVQKTILGFKKFRCVIVFIACWEYPVQKSQRTQGNFFLS